MSATIAPRWRRLWRPSVRTGGPLRPYAGEKSALHRSEYRSERPALRLGCAPYPTLEGVSVRGRTIGIAGSCLALAVGLAACGSDDSGSSGGGGGGGGT